MQPRFPWIFTLLWLIILGLMLWAGFWQLGRAEQKRQINLRLQSTHAHQPQTQQDWSSLAPFDAVVLEGEFAPMHWLLDNQIVDGQVGYFVFSAFKTRYGLWLLINRGWHNGESVDFDVKPAQQSVAGLLAEWPRPGVQLGEQTIDNVAQQHVTYLPQDAVFSMLKQRLCQQYNDNDCIMLPVVVKLDATAENGFVRKWQLPRMTAEKHQAYAVQWFTMSLVLCLLYLIFLKKHYSKKSNGS